MKKMNEIDKGERKKKILAHGPHPQQSDLIGLGLGRGISILTGNPEDFTVQPGLKTTASIPGE